MKSSLWDIHLAGVAGSGPREWSETGIPLRSSTMPLTLKLIVSVGAAPHDMNLDFHCVRTT